MTATFDTLRDVDARLAAAGHHPLTPWWAEQMRRFYEHPTAQTYVGQVGRGGAKSHTSAKVGLNETLFGDWAIPPGERHFWAYVSRNKDEATQRLTLLESFLRALGVPFDTRGDEIALRDAPRGFRVFACQVGAVSGFRCFGFSADELAKWRIDPSGADPASEVIASLAAMTVTHARARRLLISSPFSVIDAHHDAFARGDTVEQLVANAPTWVANPSVTEEQTHALEPDPAVWGREYAARPSAAAGLAFGDPGAVESCFGSIAPGYVIGEAVVGFDSSKMREGSDESGYVIGFWAQPSREPRYQKIGNGTGAECEARDSYGYRVQVPAPTKALFRVAEAGQFARGAGMTLQDVIAAVAKRAKDWGARTVACDDFESAMVAATFSQHGLRRVIPYAWSQPSKEEAIATLRRMIREQTLSLAQHDGLKREMLDLRFRVTRAGSIDYRTSGRDLVSALISLAHYLNDPDASGLSDQTARPLAGTPFRANAGHRHEIGPGEGRSIAR